MSGNAAPVVGPARGTYSTVVVSTEGLPYAGLLVEGLAELLAARRGTLTDLAAAGGWGWVQVEFQFKGHNLATSTITVRVSEQQDHLRARSGPTAAASRRHDGTGTA